MRILVRGLVLLLCAIGIGAALAQSSPKPPSVPPVPTTVPASVPRLTDLETLRLENLQLKATVLQQQQQQLQQEFMGLIQSISAEHPGFTFNPNSRTFAPAPKPVTNPPAAKKDGHK